MSDSIDIDSWPINDLNIDFSVGCSLRTDTSLEPMFTCLSTKKPYLINPLQVECVTGEWNKDKGEYGVRIYFVSGKEIWIGGDVARGFIRSIYRGSGIEEKFDERVKAGPPTV